MKVLEEFKKGRNIKNIKKTEIIFILIFVMLFTMAYFRTPILQYIAHPPSGNYFVIGTFENELFRADIMTRGENDTSSEKVSIILYAKEDEEIKNPQSLGISGSIGNDKNSIDLSIEEITYLQGDSENLEIWEIETNNKFEGKVENGELTVYWQDEESKQVESLLLK